MPKIIEIEVFSFNLQDKEIKCEEAYQSKHYETYAGDNFYFYHLRPLF